MKQKILRADYANPRHQRAIIQLMSEYSEDPMGAGKPLAEFTRQNLVMTLARFPTAFSVLAFDEEMPVGLVNCFETLSTFACQALINIHDVIVTRDYRGKGVSHKMLEKVESIARARSACKLTLEVLQGNHAAQTAYRRFGFEAYELNPENGTAMFWQKPLN